MFNKLYEKTKNFIKRNYKEIIGLAIFAFVMLFPLPYYIYAGGGTIDIANRVSIDGETKSNGSFNLAYVTQLKGTIPTLLLSYLIPSFDRVEVNDYKLNENETEADVSFREKLSLMEANQTAIKLAYEKAGATFTVKKANPYVIYINEEADTSLKIGDILKKVNEKVITDIDVYKEVVANTKVNEKLNLVVERNGKEVNAYATVKTIDNSKITGISITQIYDYEVDPKLTLSFKSSETGPSGGLMLTLAIYDKLVEEDITHGLKIVGTGTISSDGTVGEIGGVKYKLQGAVADKANVFICPLGNNYDEVVKLVEEKKYNIKVIGVSTFNEALEQLEKLR